MKLGICFVIIFQLCLATSVYADEVFDEFSKANGKALAQEFLLICLNRHGRSDEVILGATILKLPVASNSLSAGFKNLPKRYVDLATFASVGRFSPYALRLSAFNDSETKASTCEFTNPMIAPSEAQNAIQWLETEAGFGQIVSMNDSDGIRTVVYDATTWADKTAILSSLAATYHVNKTEPGLSLMFMVGFKSN